MSYLACKNPNCASEGEPHPNCKCYGGYAKGGDVSFCSEARAHDKGCEYYAEGGIASNDVTIDQTPSLIDPKDVTIDNGASSSINPNDVTIDQKPDSYIEQLKAGVEGGAQGFLGPLATLGETKILGVKPEDIAQRANQYPLTHAAGEAAGLIGGLTSGVGEAGLIASGVEHLVPEAATVLGKVGSSALKGFIENGMIQGGDEISKGILGQADQQSPVASALMHMGAAGLFGGLTGGTFKAAGQGLEALNKSKLPEKAQNYLIDVGAASENYKNGLPIDTGTAGGKGFQGFIDQISNVGQNVAGLPGAKIGGALGGPSGAVAGYETSKKLLGPFVDKFIGKNISPRVGNAVYAASLKALSSGSVEGIPTAIQYAVNAARGQNKMANAVGGLFKLGGQRVVDEYANDKHRDDLKEFIDNGGISQEMQDTSEATQKKYAEGGDVMQEPNISKPNHLEKALPEQNMLLSAAKARVNGYLSQQRPVTSFQKLPYDDEPKNPEKDRSYDRAINIALQPLSILNNIKDGSITPEHIQHIKSMYPEVYSEISKEMTKQIADGQLKKEKPGYKERQGMGLFLGSPLDGSFTPQAIQAAQMTFVQQKAAQAQAAQPQKNKKGTSSLGKIAQAYTTGNDARQERQQKY